MRHSAILVYPIVSVPHCGLFNRWAQLVPLAKTSLLSEQIAGRTVENLRRFGGAATEKFRRVRHWPHGAVLGTLAAQLSQWSRKRMQPISILQPAIEWLWALAVHQMRLGFALCLLTISNFARRRTQLKICRSPAIEKLLSPANPKARQCKCSSRKVAVSCKRSVAAKLVPTS